MCAFFLPVEEVSPAAWQPQVYLSDGLAWYCPRQDELSAVQWGEGKEEDNMKWSIHLLLLL